MNPPMDEFMSALCGSVDLANFGLLCTDQNWPVHKLYFKLSLEVQFDILNGTHKRKKDTIRLYFSGYFNNLQFQHQSILRSIIS